MGFIISLMVSVLLIGILNRIWCFWCRSKVCLVGKTAIVVGGVSGLGYEIALNLASRGCRVIIADIANTFTAVEEIIKETHNSNVIGKKIDLQSFKSVREFAKDINETEPSLHILMCNAGIGELADLKKTEDGLQKTMQVNYYSHFLLTHLLIDLLKKSAPSRIVYTSSILAYISDITAGNLEELLDPKSNYQPIPLRGGTYANSKLAITAATNSFAKKLKDTGVTVNVVHPGGVKTQIYKSAEKNETSFVRSVLKIMVWIFGKTPEEGAQTLIHLAVSDSLKNVTGQSFYEGLRVFKPYQISVNFCDKVWDLSIKYTKLGEDEIKC